MHRLLGRSMFRPQTSVNVRLIAFVMIVLGMYSGTVDTALAQQQLRPKRVQVEVGKTIFVSIAVRQVIRARASYDASVVSAGWNTGQNKFAIRGKKPTRETEITYEGVFRRIIFPPIPRPGPDRRPEDVNRPPREENVPFTGSIYVTVLSPRTAPGPPLENPEPQPNPETQPNPEPRTQPETRRYDVTLGRPRTDRVKTFLGPAFSMRNEEGVKWRNLRWSSEHPDIARVSVDSDRFGWLEVHVTGVKKGKTRIVLSGQRRFRNKGQEVAHTLNVTVRGVNPPVPPNKKTDTTTELAAARTISWDDTPRDLDLLGQEQKRFTFKCPRNPDGAGRQRVWGTDVYTGHSGICRAAVHAGLITFRSGGVVGIEIRPDWTGYAGTPQNGVTSERHGPYKEGSFVLRGGGYLVP